MRRVWIGAIALLCSPSLAVAQEASAAGWLGAGMFGAEPAATVDLGVDLAGRHTALGIGGRLRWLASGVRAQDWDEASEWVGLIRYLVWRTGDDAPPDRLHAAVAVGRLGGVVLGHGSVIDGFTTGLDVDHGQVGLQLRGERGDLAAEAVVDDLVEPRIAGARARVRLPAGVEVGVSAAGDVTAPTSPVMDSGTRPVLFVVGDAQLARTSDDRGADGRVYADLVTMLPAAVGVHLGAAGALIGDAGTRVGLRAEARLGSSGYLPGWIGPLYQRVRADELERARGGGLGGAGGLGELTAEDPRVGAASLAVARRAGAPWLVTGRLAAPAFRGVQAALWASAEVGGADAMAMEARARLPGAMFVVVEAAHLFRVAEMGPEPIWIATAAVGGVLGE